MVRPLKPDEKSTPADSAYQAELLTEEATGVRLRSDAGRASDAHIGRDDVTPALFDRVSR